MMYVPCCVTQVLAIRFGLKLRPTQLIPATLSPHAAILAIFLSNRSQASDRMSPTYASLALNVGLKFLQHLGVRNLTLVVSNAAFSAMPPGRGITRYRTLRPSVSSFPGTLSLKRASPIGLRRVWGSKYRYSMRYRLSIHPPMLDLTQPPMKTIPYPLIMLITRTRLSIISPIITLSKLINQSL